MIDVVCQPAKHITGFSIGESLVLESQRGAMLNLLLLPLRETSADAKTSKMGCACSFSLRVRVTSSLSLPPSQRPIHPAARRWVLSAIASGDVLSSSHTQSLAMHVLWKLRDHPHMPLSQLTLQSCRLGVAAGRLYALTKIFDFYHRNFLP